MAMPCGLLKVLASALPVAEPAVHAEVPEQVPAIVVTALVSITILLIAWLLVSVIST